MLRNRNYLRALFTGTVFLSAAFSLAQQQMHKSRNLIIVAHDATTSISVAEVGTRGSVVHSYWGGGQIDNTFINTFGQVAVVRTIGDARVVSIALPPEEQTVAASIAADVLPQGARGALSPNGENICFRVAGRRKDRIRVINLENGNSEDVFTINGHVSPPSWAPDGASLAYYFVEHDQVRHDGYKVGISRRRTDKWVHFVVTPPSKPARRSGVRFQAPVWSSDGSMIVFEGRYETVEVGPQTYMVELDGHELTRIGDYPCGASTAPGGVVYSRSNDGIYLLEAATGESERVFKVQNSAAPQITTDMRWLAYSDYEGTIYAVDLHNGVKHKVISSESSAARWSFRWSSPLMDDSQMPIHRR